MFWANIVPSFDFVIFIDEKPFKKYNFLYFELKMFTYTNKNAI
jgi:hypothetical protein